MRHGVGVDGVLKNPHERHAAGVTLGVNVEDHRQVSHRADHSVHSEVGSGDCQVVLVAGKLCDELRFE